MEFPGQKLITILEEIRATLKPDTIPLKALKYRLDISGVERTHGLMKIMGNDCRFYRRSLDLFLSRDYSDLKLIISNQDKGEAPIFSKIAQARELMDSLKE